MATTKIRSVTGDAGRTLDYASNESKTTGELSSKYYQELTDVIDYVEQSEKVHETQYITGLNCHKDNARDEFVTTKKMWNKEEGIQCYHAIQSFAPGEADADTVHQVGVRLAEFMWGNRYQVLVTTHLDQKHLHNHFVINSVSFLDGKKYHLSKGEKRRMRNTSDMLCRERNLSVVVPGEKKREAEHMKKLGITPSPARPQKTTHRANIRKEINEIVKRVQSVEQLYQALEAKGFQVKRHVEHVAVKAPNMERFVRLRSLGDAFTPEALANRIVRRSQVNRYRPKNTTFKKMNRQLIRRPWLVRQYRYYAFRLNRGKSWREELISKYGRPKIDYQAIRQIENYSAKIRVLCKYQIKDAEQAEAFIAERLGSDDERQHLQEILKREETRHPEQQARKE